MDTCAPVSQRASTGTPFNTHETLQFLPARLATATCCLGVKWQIHNHPHIPLTNILCFWMFNHLTKSLVTAPVKFLAPLFTIPRYFTTRSLLKNLILPCNSLRTNAFLGVFMRVGYFISRGGSPHLFPEPALSLPLFFFRQPQAQ